MEGRLHFRMGVKMTRMYKNYTAFSSLPRGITRDIPTFSKANFDVQGKKSRLITLKVMRDVCIWYVKEQMLIFF